MCRAHRVSNAFKKRTPLCPERHKDGSDQNMMPSSAGLTACATCCLWNALIIIFKARRKVKSQISLFSSNLPHSEAAPQRASTAPKLGAPGRPPPRSRFRTKAGIQASRPQAARPPRRVSAAKGGGKGQNRFSGGVYAGKTLLAPHVSQPPYGRQGTKRSASFSKKRDAAFSCVPLF